MLVETSRIGQQHLHRHRPVQRSLHQHALAAGVVDDRMGALVARPAIAIVTFVVQDIDRDQLHDAFRSMQQALLLIQPNGRPQGHDLPIASWSPGEGPA